MITVETQNSRNKTSANIVHRYDRMYPVVMKNEILNFAGEWMETGEKSCRVREFGPREKNATW